jgi:hypothetical protein
VKVIGCGFRWLKHPFEKTLDSNGKIQKVFEASNRSFYRGYFHKHHPLKILKFNGCLQRLLDVIGTV